MAEATQTKPVEKAFETRVEVVKVQHGVVFGFAIISKENGEPYFDRQGDHIPESAMLAAAVKFAKASRPARQMHRGGERGQNLFVFPMTSDIAKALDIETPRTGLLVGMKPDSEMLKRFESGELRAFSIGGTARTVPEEEYSDA